MKAVCVVETPDCHDLVVGREYEVLPDPVAHELGYVRVVDESDEDYLYPERLFRMIDGPPDPDALAFQSELMFGPMESPVAAKGRNVATINAARAFLDGSATNPATIRRMAKRAIMAAEENVKLWEWWEKVQESGR